MQGWIESDPEGREVLVRAGTGVVTSVDPVGPASDSGPMLYRIDIYCDAPHGRPGAVRFTLHPVVPSGHPLLATARSALEEVWPVAWTAQWHRHDWIPAHLPIGALDLSTDAMNVLVELEQVVVPEPAELLALDDLAADWAEDRP
jgi:hypothetical protein